MPVLKQRRSSIYHEYRRPARRGMLKFAGARQHPACGGHPLRAQNLLEIAKSCSRVRKSLDSRLILRPVVGEYLCAIVAACQPETYAADYLIDVYPQAVHLPAHRAAAFDRVDNFLCTKD